MAELIVVLVIGTILGAIIKTGYDHLIRGWESWEGWREDLVRRVYADHTELASLSSRLQSLDERVRVLEDEVL